VTPLNTHQLLLILPEYTPLQAQHLVEILLQQTPQARYFPTAGDSTMGKPFEEWGYLHAGIAALNGQPETGKELMQRAQTALSTT